MKPSDIISKVLNMDLTSETEDVLNGALQVRTSMVDLLSPEPTPLAPLDLRTGEALPVPLPVPFVPGLDRNVVAEIARRIERGDDVNSIAIWSKTTIAKVNEAVSMLRKAGRCKQPTRRKAYGRITDVMVERIFGLRENKSVDEIALECDLSVTTVQKVLNRTHPVAKRIHGERPVPSPLAEALKEMRS